MANDKNFSVKNGLTVNGSEIVSSSRQLKNITAIDSTTAAAITNAGIGGGGGGGGGASVTTSSTAPSSPLEGDLWFDTDDGTLNIYFNDGDSSQWLAVSGESGVGPFSGYQMVHTSGTAPITPAIGDLWFDDGDGTLSVYYNDGDSNQWIVITGAASAGGAAPARVSIGSAAPVNPGVGDLWFDDEDGTLSVYYNDGDSNQWLQAAGATASRGGVSVFSEATAPVGANYGDLWYDTTDGTLSVYYFDGDSVQWVVATGPTSVGEPNTIISDGTSGEDIVALSIALG